MLCVLLAYNKLNDKIIYSKVVKYENQQELNTLINAFKQNVVRLSGMYSFNLYFTKVGLDYSTEEPI